MLLFLTADMASSETVCLLCRARGHTSVDCNQSMFLGLDKIGLKRFQELIDKDIRYANRNTRYILAGCTGGKSKSKRNLRGC